MRDPALAEQLERGLALPSDWYTDETIYALEQQRVFARSWQYVGHAGQVQEPGDYFTCRIGGVPLVVVRGKDGELRAFLNICPHRLHPVADGAGNRSSLQCRYHAWTFKLDGRLTGAPRSEREPHFDKSAHCLAPAQVACLGQLVFANPDPHAPSFAEALGELPDRFAAAGVDFDARTYRATRWFDVESNWKVVIENSVECYHCPTIHPGMGDEVELSPESYRIEVGPGWSLQHAPIKEHALPPDWQGRAGRVEHLTAVLFPTTAILADGYTPALFVFTWQPTSPSSCVTRVDGYVDPVAGAEISDDELFEGISMIYGQDLPVVREVQRAHASGVAPRGTLLLDSEVAIQRFQQELHAAVTGV